MVYRNYTNHEEMVRDEKKKNKGKKKLINKREEELNLKSPTFSRDLGDRTIR